jgi:hypothetical protein
MKLGERILLDTIPDAFGISLKAQEMKDDRRSSRRRFYTYKYNLSMSYCKVVSGDIVLLSRYHSELVNNYCNLGDKPFYIVDL